jgi:hypothetical protein
VIRKALLPCALVIVCAFVVASPASAQSGGGCELNGAANFSPGLSSTAQPFKYDFAGDLSSCQTSESGAPASGTVESGKVLTDAATGQRFQEPAATGDGGCSSSTTSGVAIITWADATQSVLEYTTSGAGAAVQLSGTVVPSVTLPAINPLPGQPTSRTVTTTRYAAASALGVLTFQPPDPTACFGAGVTTAGIGGAVGLLSQ